MCITFVHFSDLNNGTTGELNYSHGKNLLLVCKSYNWLFTMLRKILTKHHLSITLKNRSGSQFWKYARKLSHLSTCDSYSRTQCAAVTTKESQIICRWTSYIKIYLKSQTLVTLLFACYPQHEDVMADHIFIWIFYDEYCWNGLLSFFQRDQYVYRKYGEILIGFTFGNTRGWKVYGKKYTQIFHLCYITPIYCSWIVNANQIGNISVFFPLL